MKKTGKNLFSSAWTRHFHFAERKLCFAGKKNIDLKNGKKFYFENKKKFLFEYKKEIQTHIKRASNFCESSTEFENYKSLKTP